MAHSIKSKKTEHSGAKRGRGAFWGVKKEAKRASKKERRRVAKVESIIT
jgi:hypothetical protein